MSPEMNITEPDYIPEICIRDFKEDSPNLLIISLNELFNKYSSIITKPHRICYYQLLLINEAAGCLNIDSKKYNLKPKSVLPQAKGNVECFEFNKNKDYYKSKDMGYAVLFTEEYLYKYPEDLVWINSLRLFDISISPYLLKLSDIEYDEFEAFIKKLNLELNSQNSFETNELCINMVKAFLLLLERIKRARASGEIKTTKENTLFSGFKNKLEENYSDSRSVQFYADLLNITPKKLNQITQEYTGMPVKKVIEDRVLLEVKRLLIYTDKTIREIGFSMGFNDPTNFNKFFKKYIKITPAEFRSTYKK